MRWLALWIAALGLLPIPAAADAAPSASAVAGLLSGYEAVPSAEELRRLGPGTALRLVDLYDDPSQPPYVRLRALRALAAFPGPATRLFLITVANLPSAPDLHAREALIALAEMGGATTVQELRAFLDDPRPAVREGAILGMRRGQVPDLQRLLRARLEREADEGVRHELRRALRSLARTADPGAEPPADTTGRSARP